MGRHSRKGRAKAGDTSERAERAVKRGDAPPSYGMASGDTVTRPAAPSPGPSETTQGGGYGPAVRGGHPEQREPGGGWGADGTGRGPAAGRAAGRVLQGTSGPAAGLGQPGGPRQDYLDAFEDDIFGSTGAVRAPAPRHPVRGQGAPPGHGPGPGQGPDTRRPGTPGPWNGYGPAGFGTPGQAESDPPQREEHGPGQGDAGADLQAAPRVPEQAHAHGEAPLTKKKGGKGRAFTGVLAAAVTTVLAVVIAGQVAGGDPFGDGGAAGTANAGRDQSADGPASRSDDDGRGAPDGVRQAAPLSYTEKMAKPFPLDADFRADGRFAAVKGHQKGAGGARQVMRYRVDVEKGLPLESRLFAQAVHKTLNDKRSWAHDGERSFERVDDGDADFVITLASSRTTDVWCAKSGLDTSEERVSCDSASTDRVMINAYRWAQGAKTFGDDRMFAYRQMLINHEVGHRIGYDHVGCPKDGELAPVMMQQTKTLKSGEAKCRPNAWAHPRG